MRSEYQSRMREFHHLFEGGFDFETACGLVGFDPLQRVTYESAKEQWEMWCRRLEMAA